MMEAICGGADCETTAAQAVYRPSLKTGDPQVASPIRGVIGMKRVGFQRVMMQPTKVFDARISLTYAALTKIKRLL